MVAPPAPRFHAGRAGRFEARRRDAFAALEAAQLAAAAPRVLLQGRGLDLELRPSTFQLNVSTLCGIRWLASVCR